MLNLGVSAWEMISNQHFTEVALVSLSYLFLVLTILMPHVFLNRLLLLLYACSNFSVTVHVSATSIDFILQLIVLSFHEF